MVKYMALIAPILVWLVTGCNNCEVLEEKLCEDLGAEDCRLWKEANGPKALTMGSRPNRGCFNARFNPMQYSPYLAGAKAIADSMRKAQATSAK